MNCSPNSFNFICFILISNCYGQLFISRCDMSSENHTLTTRTKNYTNIYCNGYLILGTQTKQKKIVNPKNQIFTALLSIFDIPRRKKSNYSKTKPMTKSFLIVCGLSPAKNHFFHRSSCII